MVKVSLDVTHPSTKLIITEKDLPADVRSVIAAEHDSTELLGGSDATQAIFDAMPGIIARRLKRLVPGDFKLAEIEMKLVLDVEIPGFKCGGDITIKLQPEK